MRYPKAIIATWVISSLTLAFSACTTNQDHPLPKKFCGIKVPREALAPLIPDGKKVVERRDPIKNIARNEWPHTQFFCDASVDGNRGGTGGGYSVTLTSTGTEEARDGVDLPGKLERSVPWRSELFDGQLRIARNGVSARIVCGVDRPKDILLYLRVHPPEDTSTRTVKRALKTLIDSYVPGMKDVLHCTK